MNIVTKTFQRAVRFAVYGYKCSSALYLHHLRARGMQIGDGTRLFGSETITIDETDPQMITIGRNVQITRGGVILSHDYGWSVTKAVYGDVLGSVRPTTIGDNVYMGMNAMILAGAKVGNNVIIGANSVVAKDIPDNCVAVGSPCRPIYTLEEYHEKRKNAQVKEAAEIIRAYYEHLGEIPSPVLLSEHFWLFTNTKENLPEIFVSQNNLMIGSEEKTWKNFEEHKPAFDSYEDLVQYALQDEKP